MPKEWRIPAKTRKKLRASMESLAAREAGKLFLIYAHEAAKKGREDIEKYKPIIDLDEALQERLKKSRGKEGEAEAVDRYNGYVLLRAIALHAQDATAVAYTEIALHATRIAFVIADTLKRDQVTVASRRMKSYLIEHTASAVSPEEYQAWATWETEAAYMPLPAAAEVVALEVVDDVPDGGESEEAFFALEEQIEAALRDALDGGLLVGGLGLYLSDGAFGHLLIEDGYIDAWAALRAAWAAWLYDNRIRRNEYAEAADYAPDFADRLYRNGDALTFEEVVETAKAFYHWARGQAWGKKLVAGPDFVVLAQTLLQSPSPILDATAPDFGRVDWASFRGDLGRDDPQPVATIASLKEVIKSLGYDVTLTATGEYAYRPMYYQAPNAIEHRRAKRRVADMIGLLDTGRDPFVFKGEREDGVFSDLYDLFGVDEASKIEEDIRYLKKVIANWADYNRGLEILSERYFDGYPLLYRKLAIDRGEYVGAMITAAIDELRDWAEVLASWPWNVDTSTMEIPTIEASEEAAGVEADKIVEYARSLSRIKESEARLFGEGV